MGQEESAECKHLDDVRIKEEDDAAKWDLSIRQLKRAISEAIKRVEKLKSEIVRAEAEALVCSALAGLLGGLARRPGIGTITEGVATLSGAVNVERLKADLKVEEILYADQVRDFGRQENLLHNAQANARVTIGQMKAAGCRLPPGR